VRRSGGSGHSAGLIRAAARHKLHSCCVVGDVATDDCRHDDPALYGTALNCAAFHGATFHGVHDRACRAEPK